MSDIKFDEGLKQLEETVEKLEDPETTLEDAFKFYKKGIDISKKLRKKLDEIDAEIKIIQKETDDVNEFEIKEKLGE